MVCHKKCLSKITTDCSSYCAKKVRPEPGDVSVIPFLTFLKATLSVSCLYLEIHSHHLLQSEDESGSQHFAVHVSSLINDKNPVPLVLVMMLEHVEINGLYTEGIYRKSGAANRMKELRQLLETGEAGRVKPDPLWRGSWLRTPV